MKTFAIITLGCKVNQYEGQQIRQLLEQLGLEHLQQHHSKPDLIVINTCCVTHTASAKSRQSIRKAQKLNPDSVTVVSGCLPVSRTGELSNLGQNIHLVRHRPAIVAYLSKIVNGNAANSGLQGIQDHQNTIIKTKNGLKIKRKNRLADLPKLPPLTSFKGQTRAFLKIQDGCDGYCSYCIIPKIRSCVWSRESADVLQEARILVQAGHKEIVVTGIFLGAYGQRSVRRKNWANQQNDKLADLLDRLAEIPNLARIRLSSLEPADVTGHLLDVLCRHRKIMPHLHLSLQSGSTAVLKRMCRQYSAEEFLKTVELVKSRLDRPAITADVIVGFPCETDADFEQTINVARQAGFAKMHVFSFSPRKGTAAACMESAVSKKVVKERSLVLRRLEAELGHKFRQQFIGETATVLIENSNGQPSGRCERYFMVYLEKTGGKLKRNDLIKVKLVRNAENNSVIGQVYSGDKVL